MSDNLLLGMHIIELNAHGFKGKLKKTWFII